MFLCFCCLEQFASAEGLMVHLELLHPAFMACLVNMQIGGAAVSHRHLN
ncbi:MAG: hypothetical protein NWE93_14595 [Candidatus Bathyarchaeota archaeon]|nr:hypothetical protein [Candidatus Bathyarchaeota archaeon]